MFWNDNYIPELERTIGQQVVACGYDLISATRVNLSTAGRTISFRTTKTGAQKKVVGPMGSNPSKPGEFPHRQTGALRASINQVFDGHLTTRVGTSLAYGRFLELGTARMAARPFMRPTLAQERQNIIDKISKVVPK